MYKIESLSKAHKECLAKMAQDLNFYGKRILESKLGVCEQVVSAFHKDTGREISSTDLMEWYEENRPVKVATKREKAIKEDTRPVSDGILNNEWERWETLDGNCWILTSAQNNTDLNKPFWQALKRLSDYLNAPILTNSVTYALTEFKKMDRLEHRYPEEIRSTLINENVYLGNNGFCFLAKTNITPSARFPIQGLGGILPPNASGAFGTVKQDSESLPVAKGCDSRQIFGTGTLTQRNYRGKKAGQKVEPFHTYGALIVTMDEDGYHHVRQIQSVDDTGAFYDFDGNEVFYVTPDSIDLVNVDEDRPVSAIQYGDIHAEKVDPLVAEISWDMDYPYSLSRLLKPVYTCIHDVIDFMSRNHHNRNNPDFLFEQWLLGRENGGRSVEDDLRDTANVLEQIAENQDTTLVIVESNHDLALTRWLTDRDYKVGYDPANAITYHSLNLAKFEALKAGKEFNALEHALNNIGGLDIDNIRYLSVDEDFTVAGVAMGFHGHNGINGSRGSAKGYTKMFMPMNTGHTHSASILDNVWTAGVSGLKDMGYNIGGTSWTQSHIITFKNGQRMLLNVVNGRFF